jgi:hypothetical protein
MTKKQVKAKCEEIAKDYGAKLTWIKGEKGYGYYIPGTNKIFVADGGTLQSVISIFCHELGHYENYLTGRFYKYHHLRGRPFMRAFKKKKSLIRYALRAEIFTDKVGKKLCAEYFPDVKYRGSYKMNKAYFDMMYQKYFGGYIIILLEKFKF